MNNFYNILAMAVTFLFIILIFNHFVYKVPLLENFQENALKICKDNEASVSALRKEVSNTNDVLKTKIKELTTTTTKMNAETKRIDDLVKAAQKKADKTGAKMDKVK